MSYVSGMRGDSLARSVNPRWTEHAAVECDSKKKTLYDPKQKEERVQRQRAAYTEELPTLKAEQIISVDEMGAAMNLTPLYGRSPTGERVYGAGSVLILLGYNFKETGD